MASNPLWCQPLARWFSYFHAWIRVPEPRALLNASIFFDFRPVAGNTMLAGELRHTILAELSRDRTCLVLMAGHATQHPSPFTLFRRPALERSGPHAGRFDIKLRAMKPLVEAARVLAMDVGDLSTTNTVERFRAVAEADHASSSMCNDGIEAYERFLWFRQRYGTPQSNGGRYLDLRDAPSAEIEAFRNALRAVKRVMTALSVRYQLEGLRLR
jgi:CBS domain-containing protein